MLKLPTLKVSMLTSIMKTNVKLNYTISVFQKTDIVSLEINQKNIKYVNTYVNFKKNRSCASLATSIFCKTGVISLEINKKM